MKVRHLTEEELTTYRKRGMSPSVLLEADDHLAGCPDCRNSLNLMEKDGPGSAALWRALTGSDPAGSKHLVHDELVAFAEDNWSRTDRQRVIEHLRVCAECSNDADDLKSFRDNLAEAGATGLTTKAGVRTWSFWRAPLWAGAAAALLLAVFLSFRSYQSNIPPEPTLVVQLNDGGGNITLDSSGRMVTPTPLDAEDAAQIRNALLNKRVETGAALSLLASPQGKLLGESAAPASLQLIAPLGTVVLSEKPVLRWRPVEGASGYVVSIYDSRFQKVAESPRVLQSEWEADRALPRGMLYTWHVTASVKGKTIRAPIPPAPEARFQVLSDAEVGRLEKVQREHSNSHLLLGVFYAQVGALDDSERELAALLAANPDSNVARELLASVQRLRQRPSR